MLGGAFYGYMRWSARHAGEDLALTPEAKAYARNLKLDDVTMKATGSYIGQTVVEIQGKIANAGARPLDTVDIYCIFHDAYGQLVLRSACRSSAAHGRAETGRDKILPAAFR